MKMLNAMSSFWLCFRPVFVLFCLYLTGDVLYRWDGFKYYASFSEFLPNVSLIAILWSIVAVFAALLLLVTVMTLKLFCRFICRLIGREITTKHILLFTGFFVLFGAATWVVKRYIGYYETTLQIKLIVLICVVIIAVFTTWLSRYKAERWIDVVQDRIAPLVWLYGIVVILSVPLATYHTLASVNHSDTLAESITQSIATVENRPNIILVTFDALTARHMSTYGYNRPTTPFISEWAKKATLFANHYAASTSTAVTTASLMTGKRPWTHKVFQTNDTTPPLKGSIESLPLLLKNNGYYNMQFNPNGYASIRRLGMSNSFDIAPPLNEFWRSNSLLGVIESTLFRLFGNKFIFYDWLTKEDFILRKALVMTELYRKESVTEYPPEKSFSRFLWHMNDNPQEPYFAWIHLFPPHIPYLPPKPYMGMFDPSSEFRRAIDQYNVFDLTVKYKNGLIPLEAIQPQIDILRDRYDEFIMYCDDQFEVFIEQLRAMNKLDNTVIILSSDHGETFSPTWLAHGGPPRESETHIPLIIREYNQGEYRIINEVVEQIDIPATILELAHIPVPSWMEGRSLVPFMRGKKLPQKPAFSGYLQANPRRGQSISHGVFAVWDGDFKLIYDFDAKTSQLFNLKDDPDEQNNLFDKESDVGQRLLGLILDNVANANLQTN